MPSNQFGATFIRVTFKDRCVRYGAIGMNLNLRTCACYFYINNNLIGTMSPVIVL